MTKQLELLAVSIPRRHDPAKPPAPLKMQNRAWPFVRGTQARIVTNAGSGHTDVPVLFGVGRLFVHKSYGGAKGYTVSDASGLAAMQGIRTVAMASKFATALSAFSEARGDLLAQISRFALLVHGVRREQIRDTDKTGAALRVGVPEADAARERLGAFVKHYDFARGKAGTVPRGAVPFSRLNRFGVAVKTTPARFAQGLVATMGRNEAEDYALEQATRNPTAFFVEVYATFLA